MLFNNFSTFLKASKQFPHACADFYVLHEITLSLLQRALLFFLAHCSSIFFSSPFNPPIRVLHPLFFLLATTNLQIRSPTLECRPPFFFEFLLFVRFFWRLYRHFPSIFQPVRFEHVIYSLRASGEGSVQTGNNDLSEETRRCRSRARRCENIRGRFSDYRAVAVFLSLFGFPTRLSSLLALLFPFFERLSFPFSHPLFLCTFFPIPTHFSFSSTQLLFSHHLLPSTLRYSHLPPFLSLSHPPFFLPFQTSTPFSPIFSLFSITFPYILLPVLPLLHPLFHHLYPLFSVSPLVRRVTKRRASPVCTLCCDSVPCFFVRFVRITHSP